MIPLDLLRTNDRLGPNQKMNMIDHHNVGPQCVKLSATVKESALNQDGNLSFAKPSRAGFSSVENSVESREQFLVMFDSKLRDLVGRRAGLHNLALKQPLRLFQLFDDPVWQRAIQATREKDGGPAWMPVGKVAMIIRTSAIHS